MKEASKAMRRRWIEDAQGVFPWKSIFVGRMIDIGCSDDMIPFETCEPFDTAQGDANKVDDYFEPETFDLVHSSHLIEHLHDPSDAIERQIKILKIGGHLIFSIPTFDEYEKRRWPSLTNPDHKNAFSIWRKSHHAVPDKNFYHVPTLVKKYNPLLCRAILTNFDFNKPDSIDQTYEESDNVEICYEIVICKKDPKKFP